MTQIKQIYIVNKTIKMTNPLHVYVTKLCFIMYGKHILFFSPTVKKKTNKQKKTVWPAHGRW